MNVVVAEHAGFCFGVQRAVDVVKKQIYECIKSKYVNKYRNQIILIPTKRKSKFPRRSIQSGFKGRMFSYNFHCKNERNYL